MAALRAIPVKPTAKGSIHDENVYIGLTPSQVNRQVPSKEKELQKSNRYIKTIEKVSAQNAQEANTKMESVLQRQKELLDLQKQKNMKQQVKFKEKEQEYID